MVREPTFLVGAEQSGSTLLRLMLDSHPEIAFAEEFDYVADAIAIDGSFPATEEFTRRLSMSRAFATSGFTVDEDLAFPEIVNQFLASRQRQKGSPVVGATIHQGFSRVLWVWPDAKFVHLVRDPRDVAPARVQQGLAGNVWHGLDHWVQAEDEWASLTRLVPPERALTVNFSDLIADHHSTLTRICQFVGVVYTSQMLNYAKDTDYREPSAAVAGSWRNTLIERDVRLIETRVGPRLTELGFEPSGLPRIDLDDRARARLQRQDQRGRALRRIASYGFRLTVADLAARALGNQERQESLRQQMNELEWASRKKSWSDSNKYRTSR